MSADAGRAGTWGAVTVDGMPLALPLESLREVVPCTTLRPLPCPHPGVAGALDVRGVTVPVLDLARWLGRTPQPAAAPCVVLLSHGGRIAGLRADGVQGIFGAEPASLHAAHAGGELPPPFAGSVRRQDNGQVVDLLSVAALAALPGVPWIDDPEPERQHEAAGRAAEGSAHDDVQHRSLMLLRSGRLGLAIDALAVHATLWEPRVRPSVLARGACRGVVDVGLHEVPAVDLLALCGLGACASERRHAIVLQREEGMVALLVDEVVEIVRVAAREIAPPVAFGLPQPALFGGVLVHAAHGYHLVLDAQALEAHAEVASLARANTTAADGRQAATAAAAQGGRGLVTLQAPHDMAVPIDQIDEIVAWNDADAMFGPDHVLRRVQVLRGRSVPVLCLSRLLGHAPAANGPAAAVLVVLRGDQGVGFGVPALTSIERAAWQRSLPPGPEGGARREVVGVVSGAEERTLPLLDLQTLADELLARGVPLAA